jgi:hypothetical protein
MEGSSGPNDCNVHAKLEFLGKIDHRERALRKESKMDTITGRLPDFVHKKIREVAIRMAFPSTNSSVVPQRKNFRPT